MLTPNEQDKMTEESNSAGKEDNEGEKSDAILKGSEKYRIKRN